MLIDLTKRGTKVKKELIIKRLFKEQSFNVIKALQASFNKLKKLKVTSTL
jgi:hypothetical protein